MSRAPRQQRAWSLLPLALLMAACGTDPAGPTTSNRAKVDPSAFFAGALPAYAKDLDGIAQSRLLVRSGHPRGSDPCALVPKDELAKAAPALTDAVPGDSLDSCRLSFADDGPGERFDVSLVPDADRSPGEEYFEAHGQTVYQGRSSDRAVCSFFFDSGLAKYPGAPRDVPDAKIQVRAYRHDNPCGLANAVATAIATEKPANLPARASAEKVLDEDPCAVVADREKASVDFADTEAYRCGLVTTPDERSLWVEFRRLPDGKVAQFPVGAEDGVQVWADAAATPLAQLLVTSTPSPTKGSTPAKRAPASPSAKPKPPSGPHCTAFAKVAGADSASPQPAQNSAQSVYVVVGGQIDCPQAKHLAGEAARSLAR
ncbi:hypothetical protein [Segniliparus rugosus]|uniref:DUF3558 domain-containing protein n=1 Tax=Segniliparus rugosus (strain ATCC BAA-974 / DSM 45345 / CCUG 50838 / CIP 108380 / JCM 13579 / CDC 945) TaxID=679197 RepID=E5XNU4_SEGRC|nr:hypothetical protein [Segniliparus rugosus]EFV13972.2 hypothetical protein HMPREF9336_01165 [Segniliparus rugosus ATCC BAA-974]